MSQPNASTTTEIAPDESAPLGDVLPWKTICELHPREWVILVDMVHRNYQVAAGRVYAHSPDKRSLREVGREAMIRYGHIGGFFTGPIPPRVFIEGVPIV